MKKFPIVKKPTFGLDDNARSEYKLKELISKHKSKVK